MDVRVLTFANDAHHAALDNFKMSMHKHRYKYEILGINMRWRGFMTRIAEYKTWIETMRLEDERNQLLILSDAYDVLANQDCDRLLEHYQAYRNKHNVSFIVSAESILFNVWDYLPLNKWWEYWSELTPTRLKYANAGLMVGAPRDLYHMLTYLLDSGEQDDQRALAMYMNDYPHRVMLDYEGYIFGTITEWDYHMCRVHHDISIKPSLRMSISNGVELAPCIVHTPGSVYDFHIRYNRIGKQLHDDEFQSLPVCIPNVYIKSMQLMSVVCIILWVMTTSYIAHLLIMLVPIVVISAIDYFKRVTRSLQHRLVQNSLEGDAAKSITSTA